MYKEYIQFSVYVQFETDTILARSYKIILYIYIYVNVRFSVVFLGWFIKFHI